MPRTLLVAPAGRHVGLTTACLGLVRALDRQGVRVAFAKPVTARGEDPSIPLIRLGAHLDPPPPLDRHEAESLLASGDDQTLLERIVALCATAGEGADVLVVEGLAPEEGIVWSSRLNALVLRALDAELVLVGSLAGDGTPDRLADAITIAARQYGAEGGTAAIVNHVGPAEVDVTAMRASAERSKLRPVALVPTLSDYSAPRVIDLARQLRAKVLNVGEMERRRIRKVRLAAMTVPNALQAFLPGALVITPGDRADVFVAAALAVKTGVPLAAILLTGGIEPDPRVLALCDDVLKDGLPVLSVNMDTWGAANAVAHLSPEIPADDAARVESVMNAAADRFDPEWVAGLAKPGRAKRLSPPAFRHRLIEAARAANKRIVLPEGAEPRTLAAASIVAQRGIAHCVLLGNPDQIKAAAKKQGITLPTSVEIVDSAAVAPRYLEPLLERRKAKGMTPEMAKSELADEIMVGTMMMALDEADGLVSGALHTTAHTIRPALQIIKTVPGCNLVSSVFFMCLPDQVLVFGDCAVNPNPTAEQLADIAIQSADTARAFGIPPRVAMLSYSTGTSGAGEDVEKVKKATDLAKQLRPDLAIDGPLQYDAAIMPDVAKAKAPKSPVAGQATVFIFPDLNTGNVTYKAVQRSAGVVSMGPLLQGLAKPVNDLSRGCLVEDIVFTITLTAIQAAQAAERKKAGG